MNIVFPEWIGALRSAPATRIVGSCLAWLLFCLNFTLLVLSVFGVMSVGGTCASGGPYDIAVQCPDRVDAFLPWCIFGALAAVAIAMLFAQGFGVSLLVLAWPIVFCSLGGLFLAAFAATSDPTGLIIGVGFEVMGLVPLVIELRASARRVVLGATNSRGERFSEGARARRSFLSPSEPNPVGAIRATGLDWLVSLGLAALSAAAGGALAVLWFYAS